MTKTSNKIVFFGSGPVAAESLRLLLKHQEVEAVITKPSTVQEMGKLFPENCIYSVNTKSELDDLISARPFQSKLAVLIDFGIIVSKEVIDSFENGIINSHFSLLPEWRGADPITFSILSGQEKTGVSLMVVEEGVDTGKILTQKSIPISPIETTTELTKRLIDLSDMLLNEYIPRYLTGKIQPRNQPHPDRATYSRKLTKADGVLDFTKPAKVLEREIRAFIEWPKSRTEIAGRDVVVLKARVDNTSARNQGEIFKTKDKEIGIQTNDGALIIEKLKPAGKQSMSAEGFLAGYGSSL